MLAAAVLANAFLLSATYTTQTYSELWQDNAARGYVETARRAIAEAPTGTVLLDEPVPENVLHVLFTPNNGTSHVFAPLKDRPPFGRSTDHLWVIDAHGNLVPGVVGGVNSQSGPLTNCGYAVTDAGAALIPLDGSIYAWTWTVHIAYLAGARTPATVQLGEGKATVVLKKGLNDLYVPITGGGNTVRIGGLADDAGVCVDRVTVGVRSPEDATP